MNLEQIHRQLASAKFGLDIRYQEHKSKEHPYYYSFLGVEEFKRSFAIVQEYAPFLIEGFMFEYLASVLDGKNLFSFINTEKKEGDNIIFATKTLNEAIDRFLLYIEHNTFKEGSQNSLFVKFPKIDDLDELEKIISQLKLALNVPVYKLNGRIELDTIDSGSIIIELIIAAPTLAAAATALKMIGDFVRTSIESKTKYHEGQIMAEKARTLGIQNDVLEIMRDQIKAKSEQNREDDAKRILNEYKIPDNPENINSFKGSLDAFGFLLDKNAEFSASLKAPEDVQEKFPSPQEMRQLKEAQKLLDKTGKDGENSEDGQDKEMPDGI